MSISALEVPIKQRLGWKKDYRTHDNVPRFHPNLFALPNSVDLRSFCPSVYDQESLGSCTSQMGAGIGELLMIKEGHKPFVPSRLFIYYNERVIEGTVSDDAGATIADCFKVLSVNGCPNEANWWYDTKKFKVKANKKVYADGLKHLVSGGRIVNQNINDMCSVLASGYPIGIGFLVYSSFDRIGTNGIMSIPNTRREQLEGGHAVLIVGYDNSAKMFIVRNSWSVAWGDKGYFYMPYSFATNPNFASDFWTATSIA